MKILKLEDIKYLEVNKFIHTDLFFNNFFGFTSRSDVHNYNTRQHLRLNLPQARINTFQKSLFCKGLEMFNGLPEGIKSVESKSGFKIALKKHILVGYSE